MLQGRGEAAVSWEEGYSAPLYARMHMRLGMWQWTVNSSEVGLPRRDEGPSRASASSEPFVHHLKLAI